MEATFTLLSGVSSLIIFTGPMLIISFVDMGCLWILGSDPGKGQFSWVTSPMGLLGCPASFQRLMETVLLNVKNVLVYIDDLLIHTSTHDEHLQVLEKVFQRLEQNHLKVNLDKCFFGNQEVS